MSTFSTSEQSSLTLAHLRNLQEAVRSFVKVHPSDVGRPVLEELRKAGYAIEEFEFQPVGIGYFQDAANAGIIYFDTEKVFMWKNTLLEFPCAELLGEFKR